MKYLFAVVAAIAAMFGLSSSAQAVSTGPIYSTFTFTGLCLDCDNPYGKLILSNYTLGQDITSGEGGNFVSFSYSSSVYPDGFIITDPTLVYGSIAVLNDENNFYVEDGNHNFMSTTGFFIPGFWQVDNDGFGGDADFGAFGVWGSAPEPATWATMVVGFGFAGAAMRRRARPAREAVDA